MDCERVKCPRLPPCSPTFAVYDLIDLRVHAEEATDGTIHHDSCTLTDDPRSVCSCDAVDLTKPEEWQ